MSKKLSREKVSLIQFFERFPDEESATIWFEEKRWGKDCKDRCCPRCGCLDTLKATHKMPYWCPACRKYFSVRTNSVLQESNISLRKWLLAVYLITTNLKGVSSYKLARDLQVTQKTAWFLGHRIRKAFSNQSHAQMLSPVEVDETYVGGLEADKHKSQRIKGTQGRSTKTKSAVVGIKSRVDNKVKSKVTEPVKMSQMSNVVKGLSGKRLKYKELTGTSENKVV